MQPQVATELVQNLDKSTKYRIAASSADYRACHALIKAEGPDELTLQFPTIMALEGDALVGVLGTNTEQGIILCNPLIVRTDRPRRMVVLRLLETYDDVMRGAGITEFYFYVPLGGPLYKLAQKLGMKLHTVSGDMAFFLRTL